MSRPSRPSRPSRILALLMASSALLSLASGCSDEELASGERSCNAGALAEARFAHVWVITIDGWAVNHYESMLAAGLLPNLSRVEAEGAWTHNARADKTVTTTMAGHACIFTGRPVDRPDGMDIAVNHGFNLTSTPVEGQTIHNTGNPAVSYFASMFDVAHDAGLRTGLFADKLKFSIFVSSWGETYGAEDTVGEDNGRNKIDVSLLADDDAGTLVNAAIAASQEAPLNLAFVHLGRTDWAGFWSGYDSEEYRQALLASDEWVGQILAYVEGDEALRDTTAIIITADHGGTGYGHEDATLAENFTIPFLVWGHGLPPNQYLYQLATCSRAAPGDGQSPGYEETPQPIRHGDAGDIALRFLGLPPIPGAIMIDVGD